MNSLFEFSSNWNGDLKKITASKHHVDLKPDSRLATQLSYWAELMKKRHLGQETDRMLEESMIEPRNVRMKKPCDGCPKELVFCADYRNLR